MALDPYIILYFHFINYKIMKKIIQTMFKFHHIQNIVY